MEVEEVDLEELDLEELELEEGVGSERDSKKQKENPSSPVRESRQVRRGLLSASGDYPQSTLARCCAPASVVSQQRWARCAQVTLYLSYAVIVTLASFAVWLLVSRRAEAETSAFVVGGIALFLALPLSLYDMHQHFSHMVSPLQIRYVRVLFMVPLYAVESWAALFWKEQRVGLELARELYEAFVIFNTYMLMVDFLGGADRVQALLRRHGMYSRGIFCLNMFCRSWHVGNGEFFRRSTLCVLQYVVVRVTSAILTFVLALNDAYCEGQWRWSKCAYPYFTLALSASQCAAIYGLFVFCHELSAELQPIHPWKKLICVKVIVFATFYLGTALYVAQVLGFIKGSGSYSAGDVTAGIVNLTVCCMCAVVAILHHFAFGLAEFKSLESLLPAQNSSDLPAPSLLAMLPRARDVVDVPLQVGKDAIQLMLGNSAEKCEGGVGKEKDEERVSGEEDDNDAGAADRVEENEEEEEEKEEKRGGKRSIGKVV